MATTVPRRSLNTLDRFLSKSKKSGSSKSPPKQIKLNDGNSDSEFELVSGKSIKKSPKNSQSSFSNKAGNKTENSTESSDESDNNELGVFHSTAIDKVLETTKSFNLDQSTIKNAHSSSESGSSSDDSIGRTFEENHSPKKDQKSDTSASKARKIPISNKAVLDHTLSDEEIIPASQDISRPLLFDVSLNKKDKPSQESPLKKTEGELKHVHESSDEDSLNDSQLSRRPSIQGENMVGKVATPSTGEEVSDCDSWLKQLKNQLRPVSQLSSMDHRDLLLIDNISEEEDWFVIQCPKMMNPTSLLGSEIALDGDSSVSVEANGQSASYECISNTVNAGRLMHILLPNEELTHMKLGHFCLSASLILSEGVPVPSPKKPACSPVKRVEFPEKLEKICLSLPVADSSSEVSSCRGQPTYQNFVSPKISSAKKKKRKNKEVTSEETESFHDSSLTSLLSELSQHKTKKNKIKDEPQQSDDGYFEEPALEHSTTEHRKKRKRSSYDDSEHNEDRPKNKKKKPSQSVKEEPIEDIPNDSTAFHMETESLDASITKKRKKKSKHKDLD